MARLLAWMRRHPIVNVLLLTGYFAAVVLSHEGVGVWIADAFDINDRAAYNARFLWFGLATTAIYLIPVLGDLFRHRENRIRKTIYLALTFALILLTWKILLVVNSELIHFPQYALLAILLFPLFRNFPETLFWATLMGAIDEAYQFFYLAPDRTGYFDFNDVLLNLLGAVLGLMLIGATAPAQINTPPRSYWRRASPLPVVALLGLLLIIALQFGWLAVYPVPGELTPQQIVLNRQPADGFWTTVPPRVVFHVVQPLEGLLLTGLLWFFFFPLGKSYRTGRKTGVSE